MTAGIATAALTSRRWRVRFSLQTLLLLFLIAGTVSSLYIRWQPWSWLRDLPIANTRKLCFSPDSTLLLSTPTDEELSVTLSTTSKTSPYVAPADDQRLYAQLWDVKSAVRVSTFKDECVLTSAIFSPDGKQVATSGRDGSVRLWPLHGKTSAILQSDTAGVEAIAYSPDGSLLATAGFGGARIFRIATQEQIAYFAAMGRNSVGFSRDGKTMTAADDWGPSYTWTIGSNEPPRVLPLISGAFTNQIDGEYSFQAGRSATTVFRTTDGAPVSTLGYSFKPAIALSPDKKEAALIATYRSVEIHDFATGGALFAIDQPEEITSVAIAPDLTLATGTTKLVRIYRRNHPPRWWGFLCLPELWLLIVLVGALILSIWRGIFGGMKLQPAQQQSDHGSAEHQPA